MSGRRAVSHRRKVLSGWTRLLPRLAATMRELGSEVLPPPREPEALLLPRGPALCRAHPAAGAAPEAPQHGDRHRVDHHHAGAGTEAGVPSGGGLPGEASRGVAAEAEVAPATGPTAVAVVPTGASTGGGAGVGARAGTGADGGPQLVCLDAGCCLLT